jgi:iron complex outermembrane receptor protein
MLTLTDDRRSALPATGVNLSYMLPFTSEDLSRIEVVRGPGAALYGPGAQRGVLRIVTRSPFESPGAAFSLAAGERDLFEGTARLAAVLSPKFAFKVSGAWLQGHDWEHFDSLEVRARRNAIARGADPDTLLIGLRDFRLRRALGEARLDWRPDRITTVTGSVGGVEAISAIDVTGDLAGLQMRNWRYGFVQAKAQRNRLFANVTYNLSDAADTYLLLSGSPLIDNSRQTNAQLQHGARTGSVDLVYGLDGRWTDPRTNGAVHQIAEAGGYVQARASMSRRADLVAAVRVDHNNRMNDLAVSPRAGVVLKPTPGHALRLTYNRAFTAPEAGQLFVNAAVPGWPFAVRQLATPQHGFTFRRDCGGICMRSSFNPAGRDQYLPADASLVWDSLVAILGRRRVDISDIPRPDRSQVATRLARLTGTQLAPRFESISESDIRDIGPRRRTIYETVELGYKGVEAGRVSLGIDGYVGRVQAPLGAMVSFTPTVFYDSTTLAAYLNSFRSPNDATRLAALIDTIRVGTVSPQEALDPLEILRARRQDGAYTIWGTDATFTAALSSRVEVTGTYSWVNRNFLTDVASDSIAMIVPRNKGAAGLHYRNDRVGLAAALDGRAVGGFRTSSRTAGFVAGYAVLDASLAYQLPWTAGVGVSVKASNLLNHVHREIDAAPAIGRLVVSKVQVRF